MKPPIKLKSALITALLLNLAILDSGAVSACQSEIDGCKAVDIRTCEDIKLRIGTGTEVFKGLGMSPAEAEARATEFAERPSGLAALNRVARSRGKVTVVGPNKFDIKIIRHYDPGVRIYFELMHAAGYLHLREEWNPYDKLAESALRTIKPWLPMDTEKNIYEWVLEQTQSIMGVLGDPARVVPGETIRGGVKLDDDLRKAQEIQSRLRIRSADRLTFNSMKDFLTNPLMYKWFIRLGSNMEKRARFMAVCFDMIAANEPLTETNLEDNYRFVQTIALAD